MRVPFLALLLALLAGPGLAEQRLGLVPPSDGTSLRPPMRTYGIPEFHPPRTQYRRSQVVYKLPDGLRGIATRDRRLSDLCRRGAFVQRIDGFYWARAADRRYGVAFGNGTNLLDAQSQRAPGKVYFFEDQDSRCSVYIADQRSVSGLYIGP
ncbi:hypothetical protein HL658_00210 [Azospirillum sp. RWY-5-1]|uniref:Secreted protein n=1 Tax=Azospirillum oleiclasticum TaxID=2735135 RepID=A0ABX2T233_9PROT|nr:hypothetical protein [Azospirillum oleiclasticum]NYZ10955.1 hypothetical protein [Azospirillum oleiclasticum]NYZ18117.1 hypothetical protein [Azospirillum oleiclasticum]